MALVRLRSNYHRILDKVELMLPGKLRPFYNHPAGPKTVFFWAPMFKWGLVMAGLADMTRPADKLSGVPVRGAHSHRSGLVPVLAGDHPQELEPVRRQLLRWCRWEFPALQNLEVQTGTEDEGEGGAVVRPVQSDPTD
ncbi:hypothetical protein AAFF_G00259480 [Aldrovandia affinis]|uniref:Mitochondrial pyruvate carrier n=1 Tax=Aldrovandia affinis TaxID=143900 RepID=A0AAD7RC25_9TELE|nr:hypothetical protein AAFF_G00259480 [Aldrovandia affinis]